MEMVEKMFDLVFNNKSLQINHRRLAETKTIYGYYTINVMGNPQKGRELFTQAIKLSPRNYQYWENLVNLLIAMGEYNDAQQQLELLKTKNTYGGNDALYDMLQGEINAARKSSAASTPHESPESS